MFDTRMRTPPRGKTSGEVKAYRLSEEELKKYRDMPVKKIKVDRIYAWPREKVGR